MYGFHVKQFYNLWNYRMENKRESINQSIDRSINQSTINQPSTDRSINQSQTRVCESDHRKDSQILLRSICEPKSI